MTLLDVFDWLETTSIGATVRDSVWLFPVIESIHLIALASIAGAVLVVDLHLLGVGMQKRPVEVLAADAQPWLLWSLLTMFATGIPLFLSEAVKCYYHPEFWVKMSALLLAIVFTFTLRRWTVRDNAHTKRQLKKRAVGAVSISLWLTVAAAGRWIGFS